MEYISVDFQQESLGVIHDTFKWKEIYTEKRILRKRMGRLRYIIENSLRKVFLEGKKASLQINSSPPDDISPEMIELCRRFDNNRPGPSGS